MQRSCVGWHFGLRLLGSLATGRPVNLQAKTPALHVVRALTCAVVTATAADSFPVAIHVDASKPQGELKPIWRFFGADEPNYATMPNGRKLVAELGALGPNQVYFR